MLKLTL